MPLRLTSLTESTGFRRYESARRFNRDVFVRLRDCLQKHMPYGHNSNTSVVSCSASEMTVVVLGNHNFGGSLDGRVSGENIWYVVWRGV